MTDSNTSNNSSNDICGQQTVWETDVAVEQTTTERLGQKTVKWQIIHLKATTLSVFNARQTSNGPQLLQLVSVVNEQSAAEGKCSYN